MKGETMGQIDLWDISYWKNGEIDPATGAIYEDETLTRCYTDTKIPVSANGSCIITATKFAAGVTLKIFEFNDSDELQNTPGMLRLPQVYATGKNASYIRIMLSNKKSSYDFTDGSMTVTSDAIKEASPTIQKILDRILWAVFGRDVRQSIHDGIKIANDKVDEYTEKQNALDMKYSNLLDEMSKANPSLAEVVDARANAENKIYNNLKERLDASDLILNQLLDSFLNKTYPVGSIYMSVSPTNPSELFGGEWKAWSVGKMPIGVDPSQSEFSKVENTGGEKTHKLTKDELASHSHDYSYTSVGFNQSAAIHFAANGDTVLGNVTNTKTTAESGGDNPHNNMPPYIVCYMWKRMA